MGIEVNPVDQVSQDISNAQQEVRRKVYQASLDDLAAEQRKHAAEAQELNEALKNNMLALEPLRQQLATANRQAAAYEGRIEQLIELANAEGLKLVVPADVFTFSVLRPSETVEQVTTPGEVEAPQEPADSE